MTRQPKYAKKVDKSQPDIVDGLRKAGYKVTIIGKPVDLMVRRDSWPDGMVMLLEAKSPDARRRYDQAAQDSFIADYGVSRVKTPEDALNAVAVVL